MADQMQPFYPNGATCCLCFGCGKVVSKSRPGIRAINVARYQHCGLNARALSFYKQQKEAKGHAEALVQTTCYTSIAERGTENARAPAPPARPLTRLVAAAQRAAAPAPPPPVVRQSRSAAQKAEAVRQEGTSATGVVPALPSASGTEPVTAPAVDEDADLLPMHAGDASPDGPDAIMEDAAAPVQQAAPQHAGVSWDSSKDAYKARSLVLCERRFWLGLYPSSGDAALAAILEAEALPGGIFRFEGDGNAGDYVSLQLLQKLQDRYNRTLLSLTELLGKMGATPPPLLDGEAYAAVMGLEAGLSSSALPAARTQLERAQTSADAQEARFDSRNQAAGSVEGYRGQQVYHRTATMGRVASLRERVTSMEMLNGIALKLRSSKLVALSCVVGAAGRVSVSLTPRRRQLEWQAYVTSASILRSNEVAARGAATLGAPVVSIRRLPAQPTPMLTATAVAAAVQTCKAAAAAELAKAAAAEAAAAAAEAAAAREAVPEGDAVSAGVTAESVEATAAAGGRPRRTLTRSARLTPFCTAGVKLPPPSAKAAAPQAAAPSRNQAPRYKAAQASGRGQPTLPHLWQYGRRR
ncbi:hypothetical protein HYH03_011309 [Edaphochlamys debaryana]|uniref:Uncharacterized protein n=1 Tax=Edaphochlamys debaryana TaxID=47281 RepID=A0A836BV84_9CHLO|nr:hypothetical protein HYH03_011309 [Edaphochlamys debaryana]|eukprot:KAG2490180.1 hypothetical protein HYH03_011309 [Edaphochlamys debaryana]